MNNHDSNRRRRFVPTNAVKLEELDFKRITEGYIFEETVSELRACVTKDSLFNLFANLLNIMGDELEIALTSFNHRNIQTIYIADLVGIDCLQSVFFEYKDLLINDGHCAISVYQPETNQEIFLNRAKTLFIFGSPLEHYEVVMVEAGLRENDSLCTISDVPHTFQTQTYFSNELHEFKVSLDFVKIDDPEDY